MHLYDIGVLTADGETVLLSEYQHQVLLIVNTASHCGFTPQYQELQELYQLYAADGFSVLAFPCNQFLGQEPDSDQAIQQFCSIQYGITFPVFAKLDVNGPTAHPLYQHLTQQAGGWFNDAIKWNFTKFLIDRQGHVVERFAPTTPPRKLIPLIEKLLAAPIPTENTPA